jgi:hypothetical protein
MSLLAEEIVEEWLNRQGYFTIRGIKLGVHEIDLLAVKWSRAGITECRHIEVQASMRPVSCISQVPKRLQKTGRAANSAARSEDELTEGVKEWVAKKFHRQDKKHLLQSLWPGQWSSELVVNAVKSQRELELIETHGIKIVLLTAIIKELDRSDWPINSAAGADFIDLMKMGAAHPTETPIAPRKLAAKAGAN